MSDPSSTAILEPRPPLRLIQGFLDDELGWSWFCGQCAARVGHASVSPRARVCSSCGMGLLIETRSDAAPAVEDAFLVVDSRLTVQAVSQRAQTLLGVSEEEAIDRRVTHFLAAAEAEECGPGDFISLLHAAGTGSDEVHSLCLRPLGAFGVRLTARIAPCGPPRGALVVLRAGPPARGLYIA